MKRRIKEFIAFIIVSLIILGVSTGNAWAQISPEFDLPGRLAAVLQADATTVSLTTLPASVSNCGILDLYIDVNDVANLYGVDVRLSFDPNVIEVVDFTPATTKVTIEPIIDPALAFVANYTVHNEVDNFRGIIWYAASSLATTPAANGSGHVARIQLRAKSDGDPAFAFTYIKLSDPSGNEIPATGVISDDVSATTNVVPELDIIRLNASTVQLQWLATDTSQVSSYNVYRSTTPYFYAQGTPFQTILNPGSGTLTMDDPVLGTVATNYFYALRAVCTADSGLSAASNQVGEFEYQLYETATTDFTWFGLVLEVEPAWANAKSIADHIVANSNGAVTVKSISEWNSVAQSYRSYLVMFPTINNFSVILKNVYRVEVDINLVASGSVLWAQVGRLPQVETDYYSLKETAQTDFNWVLQPLDMTSIYKAKGLADDIVNNSSVPVSVPSISVWSGSAQSYTTYLRSLNLVNFDTRFGYPYRVEVDVNNGSSITWP